MNTPHKSGDRGWHKATGQQFKVGGHYTYKGVLIYLCVTTHEGQPATYRWPAADLIWREKDASAFYGDAKAVVMAPDPAPAPPALASPTQLVTGPGKDPIKGILIDGNRLVICWREDGPRRVEASILFDDGTVRSF